VEIERSEAGHHELRAFLEGHGNALVARGGELVDALTYPAVIVEEAGHLIGALTYHVHGTSCEILTLHTARKWMGVGTSLIVEAARLATELGCTRYRVTTTNDNVDALRFYQRRGFRIVAVRCGAVELSRQTLKPEIPFLGDYGIPLRDEIELAQELPLRQTLA